MREQSGSAKEVDKDPGVADLAQHAAKLADIAALLALERERRRLVYLSHYNSI